MFRNIGIKLLQTHKLKWHNLTVLLVNYDFYFNHGYSQFKASIIRPIGYHHGCKES